VVDGASPLKLPPDSASTFADFFNSNSAGSVIRLKAFQEKNPGKQKINPDKGKLFVRRGRKTVGLEKKIADVSENEYYLF
jgi:hypothetical protein